MYLFNRIANILKYCPAEFPIKSNILNVYKIKQAKNYFLTLLVENALEN